MRQHTSLFLLVLILLLGFFLRAYGIDRVAFRGDEGYTVQYWVLRPLLDTLQSQTVVQDPQPPLAYSLFYLWSKLIGVSEFSLRIFPTLMNTLGIAVMFRLGKLFKNTQTGWLTALLWATHPFLIWHAQDARNYAVWVTLSAASIWLALYALQVRKRKIWILYIGVAICAAYTYYLEVFILAALNLYVLLRYWKNRSLLRSWILAQVAIGFTLLPWYIYLQMQLQSGLAYGGTTGGFEASKIFTWFLPTLAFGSTIPLSSTLIILSVLAFIAGLFIIWKTDYKNGVFVTSVLLIPILGIGVISSRLNVFTPRYILAITPVLLLMVAELVLFLSMKKPRFVLGGLLLGVWLLISSQSIANSYFSAAYQKAPDWKGLTGYLRENTIAEDLVIQTSVDPAYSYYSDAPASEFALPFSPNQPEDEITSILIERSTMHRSLWIVGRTLNWPNAGVVEDWANSHLQLVREMQLGGLPARQYMNWEVANEEIRDEKLVTYENLTELRAAQVFLPEPDGHLTIWLYWQPLSTSEQPLTVFVHLIGEHNPQTGSPLWSQQDHLPQNGRINTDSWSTTEIYRDSYRLPLEFVQPGTYELVVGFYDPETGSRIRTTTGADFYPLGNITLEDSE